MSNKRTKIFGNACFSTGKACAIALAATMALGVTPLACAPAAFADDLSGIAGAASTANSASTTLKLMSVSSVIDQAAAQAGSAKATDMTETAPAQMDEIASTVIKKATQAKAAAKTAKVTKTLKVAKNLTGTPYVYGGSTPSGFDCSGFTMYCYGKAGVSLTHNAQAQFNQTRSVSTANMKKGDLVFFGSSTSSITHVGIYVGNGKYIHSPQTGEYVRTDSLSSRSNFVGATRPVK